MNMKRLLSALLAAALLLALAGCGGGTAQPTATPAPTQAQAADTPDADVTSVDLLSHSQRQPLAVMWSDGGEYRPLSSARMSNTFPFGYRQ